MITTIATCWEIHLQKGLKLFFTDHDRDISAFGAKYLSNSNFSSSAISSHKALSPDHFELVGAISDDTGAVSMQDILLGGFDNAHVEYFKIDYQKPNQKFFLKTGQVADVVISKNTFVLDVRSKAHKLKTKIGELYSPFCRAVFCDNRCSLKEQDYIHQATISNHSNNQLLQIALQPKDAHLLEGNFFENGYAIFTNQHNQRYQIIAQEYDKITLSQATHFAITQNEKVQLVAGCDKAYKTCINKFGNAINFRGEPFVNDVKLFKE